MMDFKNAAELLSICETNRIPVSEAMKNRERLLTEVTDQELTSRMNRVLEIMKQAVNEPLENPRPSMGGLIGGEARLVNRRRKEGNSLCGSLVSGAIAYAMAVDRKSVV